MKQDVRIPIRFINCFSWRVLVTVSAPATIIFLINGKWEFWWLLLLVIAVGVASAIFAGRDTMEYYRDGKWRRI